MGLWIPDEQEQAEMMAALALFAFGPVVLDDPPAKPSLWRRVWKRVFA